MAFTMRAPSAKVSAVSRRPSVQVRAAWKKVCTKTQVENAEGKRMVVEVDGKRVLLASADNAIYAVSNKCSHLGLPLVGKTAMMQGKVQDKCIVCPAHGTAYNLETGAVQGKWCPSLPEQIATGFGMTPAKPLPTFQSRVTESGDVEVNL